MELRLTTGKTLSTLKGESILNALKRHEIYLVSGCGGKGVCGRCKVRLIKGKTDIVSYGKLTQGERKKSLSLACQTFPLEDILIEIPEDSRLVIGDKIAISRSRDLFELLRSFKVDIKPIVKRIELELPPPTIHDHISDLERLKRALNEKGMANMRFSHAFTSSLSKTLRETGWSISLAYTDGPEAIFISKPEIKDRYGIAVDIGTTTVVLYLVDLSDGRLIDVGSTYNSQIRLGDDVITRIIYAGEGEGLDELRNLVIEDINNLLEVLLIRHNIRKDEVESATISGNTTMSHLFWGLDPKYIREDPYIPTVNFFPMWKAGRGRLEINPQAPIYTMPCPASYVGGDIVSGLLASKLHRGDEISLFMDIGTNGEIAIGNKEWLLTAACSAGPCFEGSGIKCGMRATEGAIESVLLDPLTGEPATSVIGNNTPIGICGSGMIDAISEMFLKGIIDQKGRFVTGKKWFSEPSARIRESEEGLEFVIYKDKGRDITLTEPDIENILRAKAAIYAGISLLLKEVHLTMDAIHRVYIAGGFGNYLNVRKAIIIGMLPDIPEEKYSFLGNTSIGGAYLCLLSEEMRKEAEDIAMKMTYIELSAERRFMDEYLSALFFPHTDISQFPNVKRLMRTE